MSEPAGLRANRNVWLPLLLFAAAATLSGCNAEEAVRNDTFWGLLIAGVILSAIGSWGLFYFLERMDRFFPDTFSAGCLLALLKKALEWVFFPIMFAGVACLGIDAFFFFFG